MSSVFMAEPLGLLARRDSSGWSPNGQRVIGGRSQSVSDLPSGQSLIRQHAVFGGDDKIRFPGEPVLADNAPTASPFFSSRPSSHELFDHA